MGRSDFKPGLESLRGIAALAVAVAHSMSALPATSSIQAIIDGSLLRVITPSSAVVIFFVLSGYVLGQSFAAKPDYREFVIRRVFRIMPALIASLLIAFCIRIALSVDAPPETTGYFRTNWWPTPTLQDLWNNLVFADFRVNGPTWSLWPELIGSALLPILIYMHLKTPPKYRWVLFAFLATAIAFTPMRLLLYFYGGWFIADRVSIALEERPAARFVVLTIGLGLIVYFGPDPITFKMRTIVPSGIGAALLVAAIASTRYSVLETAPLRFIGRISYSLYLLHWPVFYAVTVLLLQAAPSSLAGNPTIGATTLAVAIPLSALAHRWIELPAIALGRKLITAISRMRVAPQVC